MLRFPLRLTADLAKARFARGVRPVLFLDAAEVLHHAASHPVPHEKIRDMNASFSPVVWIGGSEPLEHPGISHMVRGITQTGHFVFLETDGRRLRRRIHEFQPVSRLFLTVRLDLGTSRGSSRSLRSTACELAVEGIRAARLSGFLICIHTRVHQETELAAIAELVQFSQSLDIDGIVISPVKYLSNSSSTDAIAVQRKTAQMLELLPSMWWRSFSRLVEPVLANNHSTAQKAEPRADNQQEEAHANEEGVRVA